jgi:hypothetical protein
MVQVGDRQGSLASFLVRLRPGSECACCEGRLEADTSSRRASRRGTAGGVGPAPGLPSGRAIAPTALFCPVCGCEVSEEDAGDDAEWWSRLGSAA